MTNAQGHLFDQPLSSPFPPDILCQLPAEPDARRRALAALLARHPDWRHTLKLFNEGFYWEAHESWERFWHALGRTTPESRFIQGLIRLAAACVKIREGNPEGVSRHARRARELLVGPLAHGDGVPAAGEFFTLGLAPATIAGVLSELDHFQPACWHTAKTPVVRVLASDLRLTDALGPQA